MTVHVEGEHDDEVSRAALLAATAAQQAEAELQTARLRAAEARQAASAAGAADAAARTDLQVVELAMGRAERELIDVRARLAAKRAELGRLARNAYEQSSTLAEWSVVINAQTPQDLASRLAFLHNIASIGNGILDDLREARADLVAAVARLSAAREHRAAASARASATYTAALARANEATSAESQLSQVVTLRQQAVVAARAAIAADQVQYTALQATSGGLGTRIRTLAAAAAKSASPPQGTGTFVRPSLGVTTSPFGPRYHPILHYTRMHTGMDLGRGNGFIYAADDGVVLLTEYNAGYGNMTAIGHGTIGGRRISTMYGHQAKFLVVAGQHVTKGQVIGVVGSTGLSTGPHLHFEVRVDGLPIDPAPWLLGAPLPVTSGAPTP